MLHFIKFELQRTTRFERYRGDACTGCGVTQRTVCGRAVHDDHRTETLRQRDDVGITQVGTNLWQIAALERSGVQIDQGVAFFYNLSKK